MEREAAFGAGGEVVAQAGVGERAAGHHLVVAAARAVGVEVSGLHAVLDEPSAGRAVGADRAGGGDVVRGHAVAEECEHARPFDRGR